MGMKKNESYFSWNFIENGEEAILPIFENRGGGMESGAGFV